MEILTTTRSYNVLSFHSFTLQQCFRIAHIITYLKKKCDHGVENKVNVGYRTEEALGAFGKYGDVISYSYYFLLLVKAESPVMTIKKNFIAFAPGSMVSNTIEAKKWRKVIPLESTD